ncbi:MAG: hypothetical protein JWM53_4496 [bacterium]|nr:hypothetical protein [bacterium]
MQRQCAGGVWQPFGSCGGEGECAPGATQSMSCGSSVGACMPGTQSRGCSTTCAWSGWGSCGGGYVGPTTEICGDGIDNNCNGVVDEGCQCSPVDVGHGGSFAFTGGGIIKMISDPDPAACRVYALSFAPMAPQLIVIDTRNKAVLASIALPSTPSDFDISANGQYLVVGYSTPQKISVIDKTQWSIANTITAVTYVHQVEVDNNGFVYYGGVSNWEQAHRIDLSVGTASDMLTGTVLLTTPELELSADGSHLYTGNTGISQAAAVRYALANGAATKDDASIWGEGFGFYDPSPPMLLSPGEQHLYFGGYQLDAQNLARVTGATGELIFAEDAAGTFAVGGTDIFDAQLALKVASLPAQIYAAALAATDRELWYWSGGSFHYQNVDDFIAGVPFGVRPRSPMPLSSYTFTKLVADPVRPRLYGLDATHQLVVAIDTTTGSAIGGIVVGSWPSDIDVSPSGATLWVAQEGVLGLGKIDLGSWQFAGFVPLPIDSERVATIGDAWVAAIDLDQWTTPTLINAVTGAIVDQLPHHVYEGALCGTPDGKTLFVGDSSLSSSNVTRYDVSTGKLVQTARSNGSFYYPKRSIVCASDGSFIFYAGYSIEGTALTTLSYAQADPILSVTPDKRLAVSATTVYRASDGAMLGALPATASVQAASPDSKSLYFVSGDTLQTVDLTTY